MKQQKESNYDYKARKIKDWLRMADRAEIALPTFQRSYGIWPNSSIADYLFALFDDRPTGTFLILKVSKELTFDSRTLKDVTADPKQAKELVLDGQQRLTSLWRVLKGKAPHRFYIRVKDLRARDMDVVEVLHHSPKSKQGRDCSKPRFAYENNLLPIDILLDGMGIEGKPDSQDPDDPGEIWEWCTKACNDDSNAAKKLEKAITNRVQHRLLSERDLQYCVLPAETEPKVAIEIFVQTNKSSARIKMFDIAVGVAQGEHGEDLRDRIADFYEKNPDVAHYFDKERENWIPKVGEWLLKVACLKAEGGIIPKERNYEDALKDLFREGHIEGLERLDQLQKDLVAALDLASRHGGATKQTLPAWPPVHVIAALQDDLQAIGNPAWKGTADRLISAYLWRACLTDRYQAQANDRLLEDFKILRECLGQIEKGGAYSDFPPIFNEDAHPVPNHTILQSTDNPLQWINSGRFGRALAAVAMRNNPLDWVSGVELDAKKLRHLEDNRKLNRHHVFPKKYLKDYFDKHQVDHGLNGVLLSKEGNIFLGYKAPDSYLRKILEESEGLTESELRRRVETHLVPFDILISGDTNVRSSYKRFIRERAKLVLAEIRRLVKP